MYIMISLKMFFASEARANLFKLLKIAEEGEDVVIVNKDTNQKFKLSLIEEGEQQNKEAILNQLVNLNFKSKSPQEIKKIIENKLV